MPHLTMLALAPWGFFQSTHRLPSCPQTAGSLPWEQEGGITVCNLWQEAWNDMGGEGTWWV